MAVYFIDLPPPADIITAMNKNRLVAYLERLDELLKEETVLYIYGSAAFILLDEPERASLDLDVAAPYCRVNERAFRAAAARAGLPVNPASDTSADHIEWILALRLCLPRPSPESDMVLWRGRCLTVMTGSVPALIASKLIRYDPVDRSDVQYLAHQHAVAFRDVEAAVKTLPAPFNQDAVILDNLNNFRNDLAAWGGAPP